MSINSERESRIGIDIGGTFTDIVLVDSNGKIYEKKILSTPEDYSNGVIGGIKEILNDSGVNKSDIKEVVHGTTIVTNACIELKGAKVGLITTKGFRDVLEIGRGRMPELYNLKWEKPQTLIPRYLRFEVDERIDKNGNIIKALDKNEVEKIIEKILSQNIESIAVCLFNSPKNDTHEKMISELLRGKAPNLYVSISTIVMPMIKEYERTCETVVNAYVMPLVYKYMKILKKKLIELGIKAPLFIMQSSGGMITAESSIERPIEIVEGGPAGGVVGATYLAKMLGFKNLIAFDLGGTTCKASIVENARYERSAEYEIGAGIHMASRLRKGKGYVVRIPSIDIAEIGAGGGSIIWLDSGGLLRVGPVSSGARPGPACYNRGGNEPTLTDSYLILGYLNPDYLLGGDFDIVPQRAFKVLEDKIAKPLNMSVSQAAFGAFKVANSNMGRAIKAISSERGRDPRKFTLFVSGGAGSLHGIPVARELGMKKVFIVPYGGVFSAFGFLCADIERNCIKAFRHIWNDSIIEKINNIFKEMIKDSLSSSTKWGYKKSNVQIEQYVDLRYLQQGSELSIPLETKEIDIQQISDLSEKFNVEHEKTFGHSFSDIPLEVVNLRLIAKINTLKPNLKEMVEKNDHPIDEISKERKAYFGNNGFINVPVLEDIKSVGNNMNGPFLIDTYDTTVVVPPYCKATLCECGILSVDILEER